jgi:CDP-diacylglycerol pyrophosphatase
LWAVVHDICVPAYQSIGVGFPCAEVSIADGLERGFAVLQAPSSATHGMAINSAASRSQDQLHIHVACIAPKVAEFLRRHQAKIHEAWSFLSSPLLGHRFAAMKVETDSLAHVDPFKLLAHGLPSGSQTLAVIGVTFSRLGFYLLANESGASPRKIVSAEALLDDKCAN